MVLVLSEQEVDGLNALVERPENLAMALRIRAFRPYPVRAVSDA
ncbi:hypothetical protein [Oceanicola sp. D3]|nr:hypothetical protein [Oceanicola sp. D3]